MSRIITRSKRFYLLNFLSRRRQADIIRWTARTEGKASSFSFPSLLPKVRKALFLMPEDPAAVLLQIPTFCAIARQLKRGAEATLISIEPMANFLAGLPGVKQIWGYSPDSFLLFSSTFSQWTDRIEKEGFDICFCLDRTLDLKRQSLLAQSGISVRVGYAGSENDALFNVAVRADPGKSAEAERNFAMARCMGFEGDLGSFHLAMDCDPAAAKQTAVGVSCGLDRETLHAVVYLLRSRKIEVLLLHSPLNETDCREMESVEGVRRIHSSTLAEAARAVCSCRGIIGGRDPLVYLSLYMQTPTASILSPEEIRLGAHPSRLFAAVPRALEHSETAFKAISALESLSS